MREAIHHAQQLLVDGNAPACIDFCEEYMAQYPQVPAFFFYAGTAYTITGNFGSAIALLEKAATLDSTYHAAFNNLGNVLKQYHHVDQAEFIFNQSINGMPDIDKTVDAEPDPEKKKAVRQFMEQQACEARANLASVYINTHRPRQCVVISKQALQFMPEHPAANNHLGLGYLELGMYREGWKHYKYRKKCPEFAKSVRDFGDTPEWKGEKVDTLCLHGEQGLGDELMFLSCLDEVLKLAKHVILEVNYKIAGLVAYNYPQVEIYTVHDQVKAIAKPDAYISLADIGGIMRNDKSEFVKHKGYLKADPVKVKYWKKRLPKKGFNVGLTWAGGIQKTNNVYRTPPLEFFEDLLKWGKNYGINFINLQYGARNQDLDLPVLTDCTAFSEDAALIEACDYVVTVNQTVYHLAGAMGVPYTCLTPYKCAWRYHMTGESNLWYPSVKQLRTEPDNDWQPVFDKLKARLQELAHADK